MLHRRVPVLKLGVWGLGGYQTSWRGGRQASVKHPSSVRKRLRVASRARLSGNSTGCVCPRRSAAFRIIRIRQAKGELHRARVPAVVPRGVPQRSEFVKLRGSPQDVRPRGVPRRVPRRSESVKRPRGVPRARGVPRRPRGGGPWWWSVVEVRGGGPVVVVRGGGPWWWSAGWWSVVAWRWCVVVVRGGPCWWSRGGGPVVVVHGGVVVVPWW